MSQSLWLKLRWLFSNIFKRFSLFFINSTCLMLYLILYLKIMWQCHSCEKLTFLQSYMRNDINYAIMSFSSWQRNTLESFIFTLHSSTTQCLIIRVTSLTIINLCDEEIVCRPSFIEIIIQISLRIERTLNFNSWHTHCTSLSLKKQMLTVIKNFWRLWQIRSIFFSESFFSMIMTSSQ